MDEEDEKRLPEDLTQWRAYLDKMQCELLGYVSLLMSDHVIEGATPRARANTLIGAVAGVTAALDSINDYQALYWL